MYRARRLKRTIPAISTPQSDIILKLTERCVRRVHDLSMFLNRDYMVSQPRTAAFGWLPARKKMPIGNFFDQRHISNKHAVCLLSLPC